MVNKKGLPQFFTNYFSIHYLKKKSFSKNGARLIIFGETLANNDLADLFLFIPHDL